MLQLAQTVFSATLLVIASSAAAQSVERYVVDANSTSDYSLRLCGREVLVKADGDDDTDIDFALIDPNGTTIHTDVDGSDLMITRVRPPTNCANYRLRARNLGDVANLMTITLTTTQAWQQAGDGRNRRVAIHNHTAENFYRVYFSNTGSNVWGEDRLGSEIMRARTNRTFDMTDGTGACRFDVRVVTASGVNYSRRNIDACALSTLEFGTEISH